jgi:acetoin:2,6-dichlorophenolindophenol oxidoreductase subunit alpha
VGRRRDADEAVEGPAECLAGSEAAWQLAEAGVPEATLEEIARRAARAVDEATEEAKAGPEPDPEAAQTQVWQDGGSSWRN